jgi:hypothetical protein
VTEKQWQNDVLRLNILKLVNTGFDESERVSNQRMFFAKCGFPSQRQSPEHHAHRVSERPERKSRSPNHQSHEPLATQLKTASQA